MTLREVLHAHVPTLNRKSTVRDAVDKMDVYQFPALVVVDDDLAPVGVLTEGDLCRAIGQQGSLASMSTELAQQFASADPTTSAPDAEVGEALHMMLSHGITLLPVVEDGALCGVVMRADLMQAMLIDASPGP